MSDVDGIYTCPPSEEGARLINTYSPNHAVTIQYGKKSRVGLGGMDSKVSFNYFPFIQIRIQFKLKKKTNLISIWQVRSACWALEKGISVVICNGMAENAVRNIIAGRKLGTFFTDSKNGGVSVESAAEQGISRSPVMCRRQTLVVVVQSLPSSGRLSLTFRAGLGGSFQFNRHSSRIAWHVLAGGCNQAVTFNGWTHRMSKRQEIGRETRFALFVVAIDLCVLPFRSQPQIDVHRLAG